MLRICSPLLPLIVLTVGVILLSGFALGGEFKASRAQSNDFDRSTKLLILLFSLSVISFGAFFGYAFLILRGC
jgi:uncharacterized protein YneF (UPF0154 family)